MNRREQGQVLPLGLVLVACAMAGAFVLFNTGQIASEKMRLANSADAAAYSGALWQARALNFQAYTNRAMVANHVAVGQAVSLHSWMTYAQVTSENLAAALRPVPVLGVVTTGIETGVRPVAQVVTAGAKINFIAANAAISALSAAQGAMVAATMINTPELIQAVAKETDSRFTTNSAYGLWKKAENIDQWRKFNKRYTKRDEKMSRERGDMVIASRDEFTRSRNWDLFDSWMPSGFALHKLRRQGGTRLSMVKSKQGMQWEWQAKDTLSIDNKVLTWFGVKRFEFPIAWATTFANSRSTDKPMNPARCGNPWDVWRGGQNRFFNFQNCDRFTSHNHVAESLADQGVRTLRYTKTRNALRGYGGVRPFWVLSERSRKAHDAGLKVRVEVSLPADQLVSSDKITSAERLSTPVVVAGDMVSSVSLAQVLYRRPDQHKIRPDQLEKANAYNPYWTAQLSAVGLDERATALLMRKGGFNPTERNSGSNESNSTLGIYQ